MFLVHYGSRTLVENLAIYISVLLRYDKPDEAWTVSLHVAPVKSAVLINTSLWQVLDM